MAEFLQEYWLVAIIAVVLALLVLWWVVAATRKTKVQFSDRSERGPARRNQALIDVAPVAPTKPVVSPPAATEAAPIPVAVAGDDLTRIKGVGPRLHQQLNALGVTSFAQIAAWNDADIDRIDAQLGRFAGRIRRDDWLAQASLLAAGDIAAYEAKFGKL